MGMQEDEDPSAKVAPDNSADKSDPTAPNAPRPDENIITPKAD